MMRRLVEVQEGDGSIVILVDNELARGSVVTALRMAYALRPILGPLGVQWLSHADASIERDGRLRLTYKREIE